MISEASTLGLQLLVIEDMSGCDMPAVLWYPRISQVLMALLVSINGQLGHGEWDMQVSQLSYDVRALLASLRKLRRDWRFLCKGTEDRWPAVAKNHDVRLLQMLDLLEDASPQDARLQDASPQETMGSTTSSGDGPPKSKLLFDIQLEDTDVLQDDLEIRLQVKRKATMDALQGRTIELVDSDAEGELASSSNAPKRRVSGKTPPQDMRG